MPSSASASSKAEDDNVVHYNAREMIHIGSTHSSCSAIYLYLRNIGQPTGNNAFNIYKCFLPDSQSFSMEMTRNWYGVQDPYSTKQECLKNQQFLRDRNFLLSSLRHLRQARRKSEISNRWFFGYFELTTLPAVKAISNTGPRQRPGSRRIYPINIMFFASLKFTVYIRMSNFKLLKEIFIETGPVL